MKLIKPKIKILEDKTFVDCIAEDNFEKVKITVNSNNQITIKGGFM